MRLPDLQWFDPVRGQFIRQRTVAGITAENTADFYCAGLVFGLDFFDANGGKGNMFNESASQVGDAFTVPNCNFTNSGYIFDSWNTAPDGSGVKYNANDTITLKDAKLTLYARWKEVPPPAPDVPEAKPCDHLCHKSGFMGFIWKIVQLFWKLFRMNPVCDCGAAHY